MYCVGLTWFRYVVCDQGSLVNDQMGVNGFGSPFSSSTCTGTAVPGLPTLANATKASVMGELNVAVNTPACVFPTCLPPFGTPYSAGKMLGLYMPLCSNMPPPLWVIEAVMLPCPIPDAVLEFTLRILIHLKPESPVHEKSSQVADGL